MADNLYTKATNEATPLRTTMRYMEYAEAYLKASEDVCNRMRCEEIEDTWVNANVAMMLA